jgi:hypothetical protein
MAAAIAASSGEVGAKCVIDRTARTSSLAVTASATSAVESGPKVRKQQACWSYEGASCEQCSDVRDCRRLRGGRLVVTPMREFRGRSLLRRC